MAVFLGSISVILWARIWYNQVLTFLFLHHKELQDLLCNEYLDLVQLVKQEIRHNIKQRWMSIKSLFCSITALVASSMGISLGAINSLKILPLILSYPSPKQKDNLLETLNIWRSISTCFTKSERAVSSANAKSHTIWRMMSLLCQ